MRCLVGSRVSVLACLGCVGVSAAQVTIDHRWSNSDAQSLIGLPMGSHKTIVDKKGGLKWSQWSLKRKALDTPIGFSSQMDGELAIEAFAGTAPLTVSGQELYRGRYPFVESKLQGGELALDELAFAVDREARAGELPGRNSGAKGLDAVRLSFRNEGASAIDAVLKLSGKERNLPGHVTGQSLVTRSGEDVALVTDAAGAAQSTEDQGLTLTLRVSVPAHREKTLWMELPYEWQAARNGELSHEDGETLLKKAVAQWDDLWARGTKVEFPQQELSDFYYSSIAYVLILTEYDAQGDLWALDGPPTSGWPAWDNAGGNAGAVWDYYLYSGDKKWLVGAYPYLLRSAKWIRDHREETAYEGVNGIPAGAKPVKRMLASKCRPEPEPELKAGEKSYWYGLLPWSYGDSGLPEGHSYSHNFLAAYAEKVTSEAAKTLGHAEDAAWLDREYAAYTADIRDSVRRAVTLEKTLPAYLPAMPTYPEGAYSQTFLAVYPTHIYAPDDALVTGLIARMEHEEQQGVPTNVAWAGPAGIWAGEAMNMAETYLLRGEKKKAADMLVAAMNHSYTTKVWKEEILIDVSMPRACDTPHSRRSNMEGTGDMPEAWANANLVLMLRDMLLNERAGKLHLLAGLPESWVPETRAVQVQDAPVTTGGTVNLLVEHVSSKLWRVTVDPHEMTRDLVLHLPVEDVSRVSAVRVDGKQMTAAAELPLSAAGTATVVEVELR